MSMETFSNDKKPEPIPESVFPLISEYLKLSTREVSERSVLSLLEKIVEMPPNKQQELLRMQKDETTESERKTKEVINQIESTTNRKVDEIMSQVAAEGQIDAGLSATLYSRQNEDAFHSIRRVVNKLDSE